VPATSAGLSRRLFLFLGWPLTVLMKKTRQAICTFKQSILLRCIWLSLKGLASLINFCDYQQKANYCIAAPTDGGKFLPCSQMLARPDKSQAYFLGVDRMTQRVTFH
jgi:hypothetical protein